MESIKARPSDWKKNISWLAVLVSVILHLPTFFSNHREGDEQVYLGLARTMGWDFSNYTTANIPVINEFANRLYRSPLFPHPPLFPYLLKIFSAVTNEVWLPLLFGLGVKILLLIYVGKLIRLYSQKSVLPLIGQLFVAFCPVICFTSSRLLIDTLFSFLLLASCTHLLLALRTRKVFDWILSAIFICLFLNSKYQAIGYLPVPIFLGVWDCYARRENLGTHAKGIGLVSFFVLTLGFSHFYRLALEYGSPWIGSLMEVDGHVNGFQIRMTNRVLAQVICYLLLLEPLHLFWIIPSYWRAVSDLFSKRDPRAIWIGICGFVFLLTSLTNMEQERYWELFLLCSMIVFLLIWDRFPAVRPLSRKLLAFSFVLMLWSSFIVNVVFPGDRIALVQPALTFLTPQLSSFYR